MMDELAYCETHNDGFMMIAYEYGLHRLALLRKTRLVMPYISSDYVFAAELALFGRLFKLDTTLSQFALSGGTTSNFGTWNPVAIQQMQAPGHTSALDIAISTRRRHIEHVRAVVRSPLSVKDKLLAVPAATRPQRSRLEKRIRRRLGMAVE